MQTELIDKKKSEPSPDRYESWKRSDNKNLYLDQFEEDLKCRYEDAEKTICEGEDINRQKFLTTQIWKKEILLAVHEVLDKHKEFVSIKGKRFSLIFPNNPRIQNILEKKKISPFLNCFEGRGLDMTKEENIKLASSRYFPEGSKSKTGHIPLITKVDDKFISWVMEELGISRATFFSI